MDALLIVDMQNACFNGAERYQAKRVMVQINQLAASFRANGALVIHIQHEENTGNFARNSHGWEFIPEIQVESSDTVVAKTCCDAFINTGLLHLLREKAVSRLFVTGCATDFCVDSTIKGAIAARFDVVVPSDAHTTADRPHVSADALIQHFNWNWQNLITGEVSIQVLPTVEALELNNAALK